MSQVYISGLREAEDAVRQIAEYVDRLRPGEVRVLQPSSVPLTNDYLHSLQAEINAAAVMLVFVGPKWLDAITDVQSHPFGRLLRWEIHQARHTVNTILGVILCDLLAPDQPDLAMILRSLRLRRCEWRSGTATAKCFCQELLAHLDFDAAPRAQVEEAKRRNAVREAEVEKIRSRLATSRQRDEGE